MSMTLAEDRPEFSAGTESQAVLELIDLIKYQNDTVYVHNSTAEQNPFF